MVPFAFAAVYLIWGSTFLAIRIAVGSIPPLLMMGVRCIAAGGLLLVAAALSGTGERIPLRTWGRAALAGALLFAVPYGALAWSELRLTSGMAALLVATLPFWMTLLEYARRRAVPPPGLLVGLVVGLVGVALLVVRGAGTTLPPLPVVAIILGELAWAAGSIYAAPRLPRALMLNAGLPLVTGGVLLLAMSAATREAAGFDPRAVSPASLAAVAYLVVFGSIVAFSAYTWLLRVVSASQVGTHAYVNPVVAVALGATLGGEPLTRAMALAAAVIAGGVALVLRAEAGGSAEREPVDRDEACRPGVLALKGETA